MTDGELPLSNVLPETAAELVCLYLGFYNNHKSYHCLAYTHKGKQCARRGVGHLCPQHLTCYYSNGLNEKLSEWQRSLYSFAKLLHPKTRGTLRRFREPQRCRRCQMTWSTCNCPCFCLSCTPGRHLQIAEFYRYPLTGEYSYNSSPRRIIAIACKKTGCYRNHPYNHHNCEYCIYQRTCHKNEKLNRDAMSKLVTQ